MFITAHSYREPLYLCYRRELKETEYSFEDDFEQLTSFLHENGILLHYDDGTKLNDLFFIDPQWLCKMAAKIITLRLMNPYYNKGIVLARNNECMRKYPSHEYTWGV